MYLLGQIGTNEVIVLLVILPLLALFLRWVFRPYNRKQAVNSPKKGLGVYLRSLGLVPLLPLSYEMKNPVFWGQDLFFREKRACRRRLSTPKIYFREKSFGVFGYFYTFENQFFVIPALKPENIVNQWHKCLTLYKLQENDFPHTRD